MTRSTGLRRELARGLTGGLVGGLATALTLAAGPGALAAAPAGSMDRMLDLGFEEVNLDGGHAAVDLPFHLPPTLQVTRARLVLGYANALAVEPKVSTLTVSANGRPLAELPLVAAQGALAAEIDVPASLFRAGRNRFTMVARQQHRLECTRAAFEELWTRLDPGTTHLQLQVAPRPGALVLRNLDGILASSFYDGEPFTVLTARPPSVPAVLEWGGQVAEAVALRRDRRMLPIGHALLGTATSPGLDWNRLRGQNYAVVGTFQELAGLLPARLPEGAPQGLILLRPLPADPAHVAILISGETDAAIGAAVSQLRSRQDGWPATAMLGLGYGAAEPLPVTTRAPIEGDHALSLAELGHHAEDLPVSFTETIDVPFDLPDDYYAGDGQKVEIELNFAYGAGLAPTSALVIRINGAPWNMLRLDRPDGDIVDGATLDLPMGLFRPGPNVIGFEPILHPADGSDCAGFGDRPMFSLFDDSQIRVPRFARLARQPDLALFAATSYPYGAGGHDVALRLGATDAATVAAAWTLRGKLAQQRGGPLLGLESGVGSASTDRHLLLVGALSDLPEAVVQAAPLPLRGHGGRGGGALPGAAAVARAATTDGSASAAAGEGPARPAAAIPARQHWSTRLEVDRGDGTDNFLTAVTRWIVSAARALPVTPAADRPSFAALSTLAEQSGAGTIVAFRSPYAQDRTATVVTAADAGQLEVAVAALVEPAVWDRLDGDVTMWASGSGAVLSHQVAAPYVIDRIDTSLGHMVLLWRTYMAKHQGAWLLLVFAAVVGLSLVTGFLLRRMVR